MFFKQTDDLFNPRKTFRVIQLVIPDNILNLLQHPIAELLRQLRQVRCKKPHPGIGTDFYKYFI